jgi:hypothetical protein
MKANITNNELVLHYKTELPNEIHNQLVDKGFDYDIYTEKDRNDVYVYILKLEQKKLTDKDLSKLSAIGNN